MDCNAASLHICSEKRNVTSVVLKNIYASAICNF